MKKLQGSRLVWLWAAIPLLFALGWICLAGADWISDFIIVEPKYPPEPKLPYVTEKLLGYAASLLRTLPFVLLCFFLCAVSLLCLSGRLRARHAAALGPAAAVLVSLLWVLRRQPVNALIALVKAGCIFVIFTLVWLLVRRAPDLSAWKPERWQIALAVLVLALLAALTLLDYDLRLVDLLVRDGGKVDFRPQPGEKVAARRLANFAYIALTGTPFEDRLWLGVSVAWLSCLLFAFLLSGLLVRCKLGTRRAAGAMATLWAAVYLPLVFMPLPQTLDETNMHQWLLSVPRRRPAEMLFWVYRRDGRPIFKDGVQVGLTTLQAQAIWVGLCCAAVLAAALLIRGRRKKAK